jgi:hypothetical protein
MYDSADRAQARDNAVKLDMMAVPILDVDDINQGTSEKCAVVAP